MSHVIVLQDPTGKFARSEVVEATHGPVIKSRLGVVLPYNQTAAARHPVAGFAERFWGAGKRFSPGAYNRVAQHALWLVALPGATTANWAARLVPDGSDQEPQGTVRLIGEVAGHFTPGASCGTSAANVVDLAKLGDPDADGGWTVTGSAPLTVTNDGLLALNLYGIGRGLKVLWSAVSQSE